MIVKNEAHCIEKCLNSVKPYISYWIICDTGSTDNTENVVKEILKDIPGEFHKHEWADFATNRNLGLSLSKNKATHTLIMDADDYLFVDQNCEINNLKEAAYKIELNYGNIAYFRPQINIL